MKEMEPLCLCQVWDAIQSCERQQPCDHGSIPIKRCIPDPHMILASVFPERSPELDQPIHDQPAGKHCKREATQDIKERAIRMKIHPKAQAGEVKDLKAQG